MIGSMCDVANDLRPGEKICLARVSDFEIEVTVNSGRLTMSNRIDSRDVEKFYFDPIGEAVDRIMKCARRKVEVQLHRPALAKQ